MTLTQLNLDDFVDPVVVSAAQASLDELEPLMPHLAEIIERAAAARSAYSHDVTDKDLMGVLGDHAFNKASEHSAEHRLWLLLGLFEHLAGEPGLAKAESARALFLGADQ